MTTKSEETREKLERMDVELALTPWVTVASARDTFKDISDSGLLDIITEKASMARTEILRRMHEGK